MGGQSARTVLVRGVGPSLATFGVSGLMDDPRLELFNNNTGQRVASNDDWAGSVGDCDGGNFSRGVRTGERVIEGCGAPGDIAARPLQCADQRCGRGWWSRARRSLRSAVTVQCASRGGTVAGTGARRTPNQPPILKLALTEKTACTIANAMKPTKMKTPISTPLAITFVNMLS